jgi:hypothetical protein
MLSNKPSITTLDGHTLTIGKLWGVAMAAKLQTEAAQRRVLPPRPVAPAERRTR